MGTARTIESYWLCDKRWKLESFIEKAGHRWPKSARERRPRSAAEHGALILSWLDSRGDPHGHFDGSSPDQVEEVEGAAHWTGEPGLLWRSLVETGWIDLVGRDGVRPSWHDYGTFNARTITLRREASNGGRASAEKRAAVGYAERGSGGRFNRTVSRTVDRTDTPNGQPNGEPNGGPDRQPNRSTEQSGSESGSGSESKSIPPQAPPAGGLGILPEAPEPDLALAELLAARRASFDARASYRPCHDPVWSHPAIAAAVQALGGWPQVSSEAETVGVLRAQFLALYRGPRGRRRDAGHAPTQPAAEPAAAAPEAPERGYAVPPHVVGCSPLRPSWRTVGRPGPRRRWPLDDED